jgi:hypothetical protein
MTFQSRPDSIELRALLTEKFHALLDECDLVMDTAEYGRTFHDLDDFFGTKGQKLLQEVFQQKLQERIATAEKNTEVKQCSHCKKKRRSKIQSKKK